MAVETPQLNVPVYQPKDMAVAPAQQNTPPQVLPAQAGFVPKSGAAAYVASNILDGWMKGREHAQQMALAKAQNQVQGADYAYQTMAKNYNDLLKQGISENDPEVQKAKQGAVEAWNAKLNVMGQYAIPDKNDKSHKKEGAKAKTEGIFSHIFGKAGVTPEMIPQASLAILKSSPPPGLGLTTEDKRNMAQTETAQAQTGLVKTEAQAAQLQLQQEQAKAADDAKMQAIVKKPEAERTLAEQDWLKGWQRVQHINDPQSKQLADDILTKIQKGEPLNDTQRNFAYANRLLTAPQATFRTDANGRDQMVMISPDGKVLGTTNLGRHYEPDQVGPAMRLAQAQQKALYTLFDKGAPPMAGETPESRKQRIWGMVAAHQTGNPALTQEFLSADPQQQEKNQNMVSSVLASIWKNPLPGNPTPQEKEDARAALSNFIIPSDQDNPESPGIFTFRAQVAGPIGNTGGGGFWWGTKHAQPGEDEYAGNLVGRQKLQAQQAALFNKVRQQLQMKFKNITPMQLDAMIPPWLSGKQEPQAMTATPGQGGGAPQAMQATPGSGQVYGTPGGANRKYTVKTSDGTTSTVYMTPQDAAELKSQGAQVTE